MALSDDLISKQELLNAYKEAEKAILNGAQSYAVGGRTLTRGNLMHVVKERKELEKEVATLKAAVDGKGRRKAFRVVPRDL